VIQQPRAVHHERHDVPHQVSDDDGWRNRPPKRRSLELATTTPEQRFLTGRLEQL
jgi:hypothetical protein